MRWKAPIAAFAAVCLVGCTGSARDGSPSSASAMFPPPPVSPSAAPTPTTPAVPSDVPTTGPNLRYRGEKPPVEPVAALEHSAAGAKSFAEFFIKTIDWGYATVSGAYLRHFAGDECVSCTSIAVGLDRDRAVGRRYIGGRLTVVGAEAGADGWQHGEAVTANGTSFEIVDRGGKAISAEPAHAHLIYDIRLDWQVGTWLVRELRVTL